MEDIFGDEIVNLQVTDEQVEEARRLQDDPAMMLALIDLLFMGQDSGKVIPS